MKPTCKLIGEDGNVFNLIGLTSATLKRAGLRAEAKQFCERAFACHSYGEVLVLIQEYVDVTGAGEEELEFEVFDWADGGEEEELE